MKIDNIDNERGKKGFIAMSRKQMRKDDDDGYDKRHMKKSDQDSRTDRANKIHSMAMHSIEYDPYDDPHDEMFD